MEIRENVLLRGFSNYKIGGKARYFAEAASVAELKEALKFAKSKKLPVFILGGGTNLLFSDAGFRGLVLRPVVKTLKKRGNRIEAGAGVLMADLLEFTLKNELSGLEWAGGLPGLLGGAIRGNAGCFGKETKDNIVSVKSIDINSLKVLTRSKKDCGFGYRSSIFKKKKGKEIIVSAIISLKRGDKKAIRSSMKEKISWRAEKHPLEYPNIGSIFKNIPVKAIPKKSEKELVYNIKTDPIPVIPAARVIDKAGLKGRRIGGAMVSEKHTNFVVNIEDATSKDVSRLIDLIKSKVFKRFGVVLEEEVERVNTGR